MNYLMSQISMLLWFKYKKNMKNLKVLINKPTAK